MRLLARRVFLNIIGAYAMAGISEFLAGMGGAACYPQLRGADSPVTRGYFEEAAETRAP